MKKELIKKELKKKIREICRYCSDRNILVEYKEKFIDDFAGELVSTFADLSERLERSKKDLETIQVENCILSVKLDKTRALQQTIDRMETEKMNYYQERYEATDKINGLREEIKDLEIENQDLRKTIADLRKEIKRIRGVNKDSIEYKNLWESQKSSTERYRKLYNMALKYYSDKKRLSISKELYDIQDLFLKMIEEINSNILNNPYLDYQYKSDILPYYSQIIDGYIKIMTYNGEDIDGEKGENKVEELKNRVYYTREVLSDMYYLISSKERKNWED